LKASFSNRALFGVKRQWNHTRIDCLGLEKSKQLTVMAFEAIPYSTPLSSTAVIAKIARFEWEIPQIE
jgi:hypothetical protein